MNKIDVWVFNNNKSKGNGYEWPTVTLTDLLSREVIASLLPDRRYRVVMTGYVMHDGVLITQTMMGRINRARTKLYIMEGVAPLACGELTPSFRSFRLLIDKDSVIVQLLKIEAAYKRKIDISLIERIV
jgi:hypothetical protein